MQKVYHDAKGTGKLAGVVFAGWGCVSGPVGAGYPIDGIWPVGTELPGNLEKKRNALASPMVPRREFVARLLQAMPGCRVATAIARDLCGFIRAYVCHVMKTRTPTGGQSLASGPGFMSLGRNPARVPLQGWAILDSPGLTGQYTPGTCTASDAVAGFSRGRRR